MKKIIAFILLAAVLALNVGLIGCGGEEVPEITKYNLTISSTEGGSVTSPGESTFNYDEGEVVNLVAEAEEGYRFVEWTGDVATIADVYAAATNITMNGDYSITANFVAVHDLTIDSTTGGSVTTPGEGTFARDEGTVVDLVAEPEAGYYFANWTGDVDTIADVYATATTIIMSGNYSITANFNNILSFFNKHSYLPIIENTTWTYNYGSTVKVTNVDTMNNTFIIENIGSSGWMDGIAGQDSKGKYISYNYFDSPEFLPIRGYFGFTPLLYENSKMTLGFSWEDSGTSRGYNAVYPYHNRLTIVSTDINITTPGGQVYESCIVLQRDITYPNGYFWNPYLTKVLYYIKEGIGFVQEIRTWSDDSQEINYLTSYSIP